MQMTQPSPPPAACAARRLGDAGAHERRLERRRQHRVERRREQDLRAAVRPRLALVGVAADDRRRPLARVDLDDDGRAVALGRHDLRVGRSGWRRSSGRPKFCRRSPPTLAIQCRAPACARPSSLAGVLRFYGAVLFQIDTSTRARRTLSSPPPPAPHPHSQCAARSPSRRRAPRARSYALARRGRDRLLGGNLFADRARVGLRRPSRFAHPWSAMVLRGLGERGAGVSGDGRAPRRGRVVGREVV